MDSQFVYGNSYKFWKINVKSVVKSDSYSAFSRSDISFQTVVVSRRLSLSGFLFKFDVEVLYHSFDSEVLDS